MKTKDGVEFEKGMILYRVNDDDFFVDSFLDSFKTNEYLIENDALCYEQREFPVGSEIIQVATIQELYADEKLAKSKAIECIDKEIKRLLKEKELLL